MRSQWQRVRFAEIVRPNSRPYTLGPEQDANLVGMRLYGAGPFHRELKPAMRIAKKTHFVIKTGDVIYNKLFAWKGTFGIVPPEFDGMFVSDKFPTYELDRTRVDERFLRWYFRCPPLWEEARVMSTGSAALSKLTLNPPKFLHLTIPLPPLAEQRRVVTRIEGLASEIHEARTLRNQAAEEAEALRVSALVRSLSSGDSKHSVMLPEINQKVRRGVEAPKTVNEAAKAWHIPVGWRRLSVAELLLCGALLDVKDGNHGSNHPRSSEFVEQGTPFLMASDLNDGDVHWEGASRLGPETMSRLRVGFSRPNDVLFTHKASIGKTAIADRDCVLSPQVTYYRCNPQLIEPRWLQSFLSSSLFLSQLADIQAQSTRDFVSISKQYQQFVLLPPLPEQRRIVAELDELHAEVNALKGLQAETAAELDALLPSILDKAFKGEL